MTTAEATMTDALTETFRASMRVFAGTVCLVTARDAQGGFHGMAVTSASSLSMDPPSMMVAVNRATSIHPVISQTGFFCLNLMMQRHAPLLERFSRSDLRDQRFAGDHWRKGRDGLPVLKGALAAHLCEVVESHDFGTHTVFFGRVNEVETQTIEGADSAPIIWLNGAARAVTL